jgi:RecA-family ATPase
MPKFTAGVSDRSFTVVQGGKDRLPKPLQDYLDNPQPKGTRNDALLKAAIQARDCGWPQGKTEAVLEPLAIERDGLNPNEVRATLRSAYSKAPRDVPRGTNPDAPIPAARHHHKVIKDETPEAMFELDPEFIMPDAMASPAIALLEALYDTGETIFFSSAKFDPTHDAKEGYDPREADVWERDALLKILREKTGGSLEKIFDTKKGLYFALNPLLKNEKSRTATSIADYRYGLIEFDSIPKPEQLQVLLKSKLPLAAVLDSGRASIHGIVRINAGRDAEKYRVRMETIIAHLRAYKPDPNTKDVARLSRFPGVFRADTEPGEQKLLMLGVGLDTFEDWEREIMIEQDGLPAIEDMFDLLKEFRAGKMPKPEEVIENVAYRGCKLVFGGASKARKTWALADLAASVMSGGKWFNHLQCRKGNVLYLNMELPKFFMVERIDHILKAKGIDVTDRGQFRMINLRGFSANLADLRPKLERAIEQMNFSLILLDPTYKLMPGGDENGTQDVSLLLNEIERLAVKSDALCAFGSHFSKGNQSLKKAIDRISGTGVFARDPDSILTMTDHANTDSLTIEFNLRLHAPMEWFVVKWEFPVFALDKDADPSALAAEDLKAATTSRKPKKELPPIMMTEGRKKRLGEYVAATPKGKNNILKALEDIFEVDPKRAKMELLPLLIQSKILIESDAPGKPSGPHPTKIYSFDGSKNLEPKLKSEPKEDEEF